MTEKAFKELTQDLEKLVPMLAKAVVRQLYADEWLDIHQVVKLVKMSRSRLDELKAGGDFPQADRWVAGKQVWNRLTVEEWKGDLDAGAVITKRPGADQRLLDEIRRRQS